MILNKINTLTGAEERIYNNIKSKDCLNFDVPFSDFTKLKFFIDFGINEPSIVTLQVFDLDTNLTVSTLSNSYVIGSNSNGFYGVFTNISNAGVTNFVLQFEVIYTDNTTEYFESESFLFCSDAATLESCYGAKIGLTDYYDISGIYYGYPSITLFGDPLLKYTYFMYVTDATIIDDDTKEYVNTIVNNSVSSTTITYNGIFGNMLYPAFYAEQLESLLSRGSVLYNGKEIIIESFTSKKICCGFDIFGKTKRVENLEYLCSCEALTCCNPVFETATIEVITDATLTLDYIGGEWSVTLSHYLGSELKITSAFARGIDTNCNDNFTEFDELGEIIIPIGGISGSLASNGLTCSSSVYYLVDIISIDGLGAFNNGDIIVFGGVNLTIQINHLVCGIYTC